MGCIKDSLTCEKCKEEINIKSVDFSQKIVTYQCTNCDNKVTKEFKKAKGYKNFNLYFVLKFDGTLQYKCGLCGKTIKYQLQNDNDSQESFLIKCAYEGICKNCIEEKVTYCKNCGKKLDLLEGEIFLDEDRTYCSKDCFLKDVEKDYF